MEIPQSPQNEHSSETTAPTKVAAFFDLDRTLIQENSALIYMKHERKHGRMRLGTTLKAGFYLLLYHFSLVDIEKAYRKASSSQQGAEFDALQAHTSEWFNKEIAHLLLPGAIATIEWHKQQGHPCVLLSSTSEFLAREATAAWDLDDWLANRFPTDEEGRLTGEVSSPLCYGAGKIFWAEHWAEAHGIDVDGSYFYSDSSTDLPMLERVQHPKVVNPDPRLRRQAHRRGWPILDWTQEPTEFA